MTVFDVIAVIVTFSNYFCPENEGAIPISSPTFHPDVLATVILFVPAFAKAVILVQVVAGAVPKSSSLPVTTNILFPANLGLTTKPKAFLTPFN